MASGLSLPPDWAVPQRNMSAKSMIDFFQVLKKKLQTGPKRGFETGPRAFFEGFISVFSRPRKILVSKHQVYLAMSTPLFTSRKNQLSRGRTDGRTDELTSQI